MSTLTLLEIRIPRHLFDMQPQDVCVSAEWFKTFPGAPQYRVVGHGPAIYCATPEKAVAAALKRAKCAALNRA